MPFENLNHNTNLKETELDLLQSIYIFKLYTHPKHSSQNCSHSIIYYKSCVYGPQLFFFFFFHSLILNALLCLLMTLRKKKKLCLTKLLLTFLIMHFLLTVLSYSGLICSLDKPGLFFIMAFILAVYYAWKMLASEHSNIYMTCSLTYFQNFYKMSSQGRDHILESVVKNLKGTVNSLKNAPSRQNKFSHPNKTKFGLFCRTILT